MIKKMVW